MMSPFHKQTILFVDAFQDATGVVSRTEELDLNAYTVQYSSAVANRDHCLHIDTIIVGVVKVGRLY